MRIRLRMGAILSFLGLSPLLFGLSTVALAEGPTSDARARTGGNNSNPFFHRANRDYGETTARIRRLFSEITYIPEDAFDIVYAAESEPAHMAAILTETTGQRAADRGGIGVKFRPTLIISEQLTREVLNDDEFRFVLLHEFGHNLEDAKFKTWADEQQQEYVRRQRTVSTTNADRTQRVLKFLSSDLQEHAADLIAQRYMLVQRRSPYAGIALFKRWLDQGPKGSRWQEKGFAGYFARSHPDPAERIRALTAFNELMQGNKDVFPVELREVKPTHEFHDALKAAYDSEVYRKQVMADLASEMELFHRRRIQKIPPPKESLGDKGAGDADYEDHELPHLPLHPALLAEGTALRAKLLADSDRRVFSALAERFDLEMQKPLSPRDRAKLQARIAYTREELLRFSDVEQSPRHASADQEREVRARNEARRTAHQAAVALQPGFQAIDRVARQNGVRIRNDLTRLFLGTHPDATRMWSRGNLSTWDFWNVLEAVPGKEAGEWLVNLVARIRTGDAALHTQDAMRALGILLPPTSSSGYGFDHKLRAALNPKQFVDLLAVLAKEYPDTILQNMDRLSGVLRYSHGYGEKPVLYLSGAERTALESILAEVMRAAKPETWRRLNHADFLRTVQALEIPTAAYAVQLGTAMASRATPSGLARHGLDSNAAHGLLKTYRELPELRAGIRPALEEAIRYYALSLHDPAAYQREMEALEARIVAELDGQPDAQAAVRKRFARDRWEGNAKHELAELGRAVYRETLTSPDMYRDIPVPTTIVPDLRERLKTQGDDIAALETADFVELALRAITELDEHMSRNVTPQDLRRRVRAAQTNPHDQVAVLQRAFLDGLTHPALKAAFERRRLEILTRLFQSKDRVGRSALALQILPKLFTDERERQRLLTTMLQTHSPTFRLDDFQAVFGQRLTLAEIVALPLGPERKIELIDYFRIGTLSDDRDVRHVRSILKDLGEDLRTGKRTVSSYMGWLARLERSLPSEHTAESVAFDETARAAIADHARRLRALPPEPRLDALKDAVFGVVRGQRRRREERRAQRGDREEIDDVAGREHESPLRVAGRELFEKDLAALLETATVPQRMEIYRLAARRQTGRFLEPTYVAKLFGDILASSSPDDQKLRWLEELRPKLTREQTNKAWGIYSAKLYAQPYSERDAAQLIQRLFGDQADQADARMNEVFHRFKLQEKQMSSLRDRLFPKDEVVGLIGMAKLIRAAIRLSMTDPASGIEFLKWLHGRTDRPPPMARNIETLLSGFAKAGDGYSSGLARHWGELDNAMAQRMASTLTLEEIRDTYRRNSAFFRMAITADLLNPLLEGSIPHTPAGTALLLDYIVDGMDVRNVPLAHAFLESFIAANDQEGDNFLDQVVSSMGKVEAGVSDAAKVRDVMRARGGLIVKTGQLAYADRFLIRDDDVREIFAELLDHANDPTRPRKYELLREALGAEFAKVKQVHETLGSGSINGTFIIELIDGTFLVARLVQGDPDTAADHERIRLEKTARLLKERAARTTDRKLRDSLLRLALALEEYLPGLAEKMRAETDLSKEREIAKGLRPRYEKHYADLGVRSELIREAESIIEFDRDGQPSDPELRKANPKRIILYPVVATVKVEELPPAEQTRARRAMYRAEWEAIFEKHEATPYAEFDPDGHKRNWLIRKEARPDGDVHLVRIDISQAEKLEATRVESLRQVLSHLFARTNRWYWGDRPLPEADFGRAFAALLVTDVPEAELLDAIRTAERDALSKRRESKNASDPLTLVAEIQAALKSRYGERIAFHPGIRMAIKSLMVVQQHIDRHSSSDSDFQAREFARIVLRAPATTSWLLGKLRRVKEVGTKLFEHARTALFGRGDAARREAVEKADATVKLIESRAGRDLSEHDVDALIHLHEEIPERREALLKTLRDYFQRDEKDGDDRLRRRVFRFLVEKDPAVDSAIREALKVARGFRLMELLVHIHAAEKKHLYADAAAVVAERYADDHGYEVRGDFAEHILPHNAEFRRAVAEAFLAKSDDLLMNDLIHLDRHDFPEVWARLPKLLDGPHGTAAALRAMSWGSLRAFTAPEQRRLAELLLAQLRREAARPAEEVAADVQSGKREALSAAASIVGSQRDAATWLDGALFREYEALVAKVLPHLKAGYARQFTDGWDSHGRPGAKDSPAILADLARSRIKSLAEQATRELLTRATHGDAAAQAALVALAKDAPEESVREMARGASALPADGMSAKDLGNGIVLYRGKNGFAWAKDGGPRRALPFGSAHLDVLFAKGPGEMKPEPLAAALTALETLAGYQSLHREDRRSPRGQWDESLRPDQLLHHVVTALNDGAVPFDEYLVFARRLILDARSSEHSAGHPESHLKVLAQLVKSGVLKAEQREKVAEIARRVPLPWLPSELRTLTVIAPVERPKGPGTEKIWDALTAARFRVTPEVIAAARASSLGHVDLIDLHERFSGLERRARLPLLAELLPHLVFATPEAFELFERPLSQALESPAHRSTNYFDPDNAPEEKARLKSRLEARRVALGYPVRAGVCLEAMFAY